MSAQRDQICLSSSGVPGGLPDWSRQGVSRAACPPELFSDAELRWQSNFHPTRHCNSQDKPVFNYEGFMQCQGRVIERRVPTYPSKNSDNKTHLLEKIILMMLVYSGGGKALYNDDEYRSFFTVLHAKVSPACKHDRTYVHKVSRIHKTTIHWLYANTTKMPHRLG